MAEIDRIQSGLVPTQGNKRTGGVSSRAVEPVLANDSDNGQEPGSNVHKSLGDRIKTIRTNRNSDLPSDPRQQAEEFINDLLSNLLADDFNSSRLQIEEDKESGLFVYQTIDKKSGEVVRQFPPEEILKLITRIRKAEGIIVDENI